MGNLAIKRVYAPPAESDGKRILVDRLWPRGLSHQKLGEALWLREIAPSDALRHWFGHDPQKWPEFRQRYAAELDANPAPVRELRQILDQGPVVLLYAAHDRDHNNAVALRDYLAAP